tara:strand:+ start:2102 stop:2344 length:243 start_codon:yes stop_codon:yes gene_type:complete
MKRKHVITINHLRVLKEFSGKKDFRVGHVEVFLVSFVSMPTARKVIAQMIDLGLMSLEVDANDKRVKKVTLHASDIIDLI